MTWMQSQRTTLSVSSQPTSYLIHSVLVVWGFCCCLFFRGTVLLLFWGFVCLFAFSWCIPLLSCLMSFQEFCFLSCHTSPGFQTHSTASGFTEILGIWTQVLGLPLKVLFQWAESSLESKVSTSFIFKITKGYIYIFFFWLPQRTSQSHPISSEIFREAPPLATPNGD